MNIKNISLLFFILCIASHGQNPGPASSEKDIGWLSTGFGANSEDGANGSININYGKEHIFQLSSYNSLLGSSFNILGFSYGKSGVNRWGRSSIFVGPGVTWHLENHQQTIISLIANAQAIFSPINELGLGLEFWVNFNKVNNLSGVSFIFVLEGNK